MTTLVDAAKDALKLLNSMLDDPFISPMATARMAADALRNALATLEYTSVRPTAPGVYWLLQKGSAKAHLMFVDDTLCTRESFDDYGYWTNVAEINGLWAGPLPEAPEEVKDA